MEIKNAIFQDLECFGKRFLKLLWKSFGFLFGKILKYPIMDKTWVILNTVYFMFAHLTIYNTEHNPPKHSMYRGQ